MPGYFKVCFCRNKNSHSVPTSKYCHLPYMYHNKSSLLIMNTFLRVNKLRTDHSKLMIHLQVFLPPTMKTSPRHSWPKISSVLGNHGATWSGWYEVGGYMSCSDKMASFYYIQGVCMCPPPQKKTMPCPSLKLCLYPSAHFFPRLQSPQKRARFSMTTRAG